MLWILAKSIQINSVRLKYNGPRPWHIEKQFYGTVSIGQTLPYDVYSCIDF